MFVFLSCSGVYALSIIYNCFINKRVNTWLCISSVDTGIFVRMTSQTCSLANMVWSH